MKNARKPFEPLGVKARWELLYEVLQRKSPGDVVSFAEMSDALNLDATLDRHKIMGAFPRAARELLEQDLRALDSVRGVGYRVVEPREHLGLAAKHRKRADRSLVRGYDKVTHVDVSKLDPNTRAAFEAVGRGFELQMQFNKRTAQRVEGVEKLMQEFREGAGRSQEEIADLQRRLNRLEQLAPGSD